MIIYNSMYSTLDSLCKIDYLTYPERCAQIITWYEGHGILENPGKHPSRKQGRPHLVILKPDPDPSYLRTI